MKINLIQILTAILLYMISVTSHTVLANGDDGGPCDPQAEKKAEAAALLNRDIKKILPYIGCDAGDSSRLDVICEADLPTIGRMELEQILTRLNNSPKAMLQNAKWIQYGVNNDIFVLCPLGYSFKSAKNYCDETGKLQPIIEIKHSSSGYYIFGVPISGT